MHGGQLTKALAAIALAALFFLSGFPRSDVPTAVWGLSLLLLAAGPGLAWLWKERSHVPLFEVFAGAHLLYYWLPAGDRTGALLNSPADFRETFLMVICLFLFSGAAVYFTMLGLLRQRGGLRPVMLSACVISNTGTSAGWLMGAMWVTAAYYATLQLGLLMMVVPYSLFPVVRSVLMSLGGLAIFFLAVQLGRGRMSSYARASYFTALGICVLSNVLSGFLVHAAGMLAIASLAYTLGAKRIPLLATGMGMLIFTFLNLGKAEWRDKYWDGVATTSTDLVTMANDWLQASVRGLEARLTGSASSVQMTILERVDITAILSTILEQTPRTHPFLGGETYVNSLELFIPRYLKPDRMSNHDIMTDLGLRYGFYYTIEQALSGTNISVGPIAEAWANGGWLAVAAAGAFMGFFFGLGTSLAWGREPEEAGFLLAVPFAVLLGTGAMEFLMGATLMAFEHYFLTTMIIIVLAWLAGRRSSMRLLSRGAMSRDTGRVTAPEAGQAVVGTTPGGQPR